MKWPWPQRRPAAIHAPVDPEIITRCYWHGPEAVAGVYRICGECGHAYGRLELVVRHNAVLRSIDGPFARPETRPERIDICPLCTHDF